MEAATMCLSLSLPRHPIYYAFLTPPTPLSEEAKSTHSSTISIVLVLASSYPPDEAMMSLPNYAWRGQQSRPLLCASDL